MKSELVYDCKLDIAQMVQTARLPAHALASPPDPLDASEHMMIPHYLRPSLTMRCDILPTYVRVGPIDANEPARPRLVLLAISHILRTSDIGKALRWDDVNGWRSWW
jgi:hypothetical protein